VPLDAVDAASLDAAIARLLARPSEIAALAEVARARTFRTWAGYAQELVDWTHSLRRRN
jgi:hypothetical protein